MSGVWAEKTQMFSGLMAGNRNHLEVSSLTCLSLEMSAIQDFSIVLDIDKVTELTVTWNTDNVACPCCPIFLKHHSLRILRLLMWQFRDLKTSI